MNSSMILWTMKSPFIIQENIKKRLINQLARSNKSLEALLKVKFPNFPSLSPQSSMKINFNLQKSKQRIQKEFLSLSIGTNTALHKLTNEK
jgi:hypothetical protein